MLLLKTHHDSSRDRVRQYWYVDNSILVWLDCPTGSPEGTFLSNELAQHLSRPIEFFINSDECLDFITEIKHEKVFLILSDDLKQHVGGLISFNCFLSTSTDRTVGLGFAEPSLWDSEFEAVLFVIEVDPAVTISSPVASLNESQTHIADEREYLWGMNTIFCIDSLQQMDSGVWQVNLQVTSDDDPQLKELTDYMHV